MTNYKDKSALYALNSFTWKLLELNLGWVKVNGKPPIIPASDEPEMQTSGLAYIIYGSNIQPSAREYPLSLENVSYIVRGPTATAVNQVVRFLATAYERYDDVAKELNQWSTMESNASTPVTTRAGVRFNSVQVLMAQMAEPGDQEGGFVDGRMMLRMLYNTTNTTVDTNPAHFLV